MDKNEEQDIRNLFQDMSIAWNKGDGKAFGECFTENCDYITYNGQLLRGREAVSEVHQQLFDSFLKGSKMGGDDGIADIRFLTPDIAIVHGKGVIKLKWQKKPPKGRQSINTNVVVKENGKWKIDAFHNSRIKDPNWIQKLLVKANEKK